MKKILIVIICIISHYTSAQNIVTMTDNTNDFNVGDYIKDTEGYLSKFIGTWKYTNGNEVFILKVLKVDKVESGEIYSDELYGGYKYIKDGIVKVDNLNFSTTLPAVHDYNAYQHYADMLGSNLSSDYQSVTLIGGDRIGLREVYFDLEILPNTNGTQMRIKQSNRENIRISDNDFKQGLGPGLPDNVILIKQ